MKIDHSRPIAAVRIFEMRARTTVLMINSNHEPAHEGEGFSNLDNSGRILLATLDAFTEPSARLLLHL